jgi:hypothetical protein
MEELKRCGYEHLERSGFGWVGDGCRFLPRKGLALEPRMIAWNIPMHV